MRQVVLDTETTGLEPSQGHRIIEIGCVEIINRRITGNHYHQYIKPDRDIDEGAYEVHGISTEFLADKPKFEEVLDDFLAYIKGAELVIHNAPFDVGFLDHELRLAGEQWGQTTDYATVTDSLVMARKMHPGQKNNLDALCRRYEVDNTQRDLHGALLDAELLAEVYLYMTGGQSALILDSHAETESGGVDSVSEIRRVDGNRAPLTILSASAEEIAEHERVLAGIGDSNLWQSDPTS